jgi:hypothetical protein
MTLFLGYRISALHVIIDSKNMMPQTHPYIQATNVIEDRFSASQTLVIAISPKTGDIFQPAVLERVQRITDALAKAPRVYPDNILSLSAKKAKSVVGKEDGMEVRRLFETVPRTPEALEALRRAVDTMPLYTNAIVSPDRRTTAIIAQFKNEVGLAGFQGYVKYVEGIIAPERDPSIDIWLSGQPSYLAQLEIYAQRIGLLFLIALVVTGLIHYEAFRTRQGLFLPLVTALLAVVWALGIMSLAGVPFDVFNATTPILILAVAAGHAVQILKRYYEEYNRLLSDGAPPSRETNRTAVVEALTRIAPVMLTAGTIAAAGFLSLIMFDIATIRTFGIFTACGIVAALLLELSFIPALRAALAPPQQREIQREKQQRFWDGMTSALASVALYRRRTALVVFALIIAGGAFAAPAVRNDNDLRNYFFANIAVQQNDRAINERLGGTNSILLLVEGTSTDALKSPAVLRAMDHTQRFLEQQPYVGKTISLADFVRRMNAAMHGDQPAFDTIPEDQATIAQYLLLYAMSGDPTDFDSYVDNDYRSAVIYTLVKIESTAYLKELTPRLEAFVAKEFAGTGATVRLGGTIPRNVALNDVMVAGKLRNILQIGAILLLLGALAFRSVWGGIFVLTPLAVTALVTFAILGITGIPLNIQNAVTTAMGVGIGADYAIYFLYRLREAIGSGMEETAAVEHTFHTAGKAILFVATAVACGYGVLIFSWGFWLHIWMGILISATMLVSSLTALTLLPALVLALRPKFIFGAAPRATSLPKATSVIVLALVVGLTSHAHAGTPTAADVMEKSVATGRVAGSTSTATVDLFTAKNEKRSRVTTVTTKLQKNGTDTDRVVRFLSPADVRGTATLLIEHSSGDDDIWIYLPALKKVRRIASSNKSDSFVGTDFSYADVIGHKTADWTHALLADEKVDGQDCYVVESKPKSDDVKSSSGYSKRKSWIRKDNFVAIKVEAWDPGGKLVKSMTYSQVELVDDKHGKYQPMVLDATNVQSSHRTTIKLANFKLQADVEDSVFTTAALERE